jgi:hypothetical protein
MKRPRDIKAVYLVYYNSDLVGETRAISEKQAINNVRHTFLGDTTSQYVDILAWSAKEKN